MADSYGVTVTEETLNDLAHRFADPVWAGLEMVFPAAADAVIATGRLVCINPEGYAVPAADTAGFVFVGVALEDADNTGGADGGKLVRVRRTGVLEVAGNGLSQAHVGKSMYAVDDQTVAAADVTTYDIRVGILVRYVSATKGWVDFGR